MLLNALKAYTSQFAFIVIHRASDQRREPTRYAEEKPARRGYDTQLTDALWP